MRNRLNKTHALLLGLLAFMSGIATNAAELKLLRLESGEGTPLVQVEITARAGLQPASSIAPRATWKLLPGEAVKTQVRPGDRMVDLYTGTVQAPVLFTRVALRYFPSTSGWVPHMYLVEEPAVAFVDGRWQPIQIGGGSSLLVQHGNTLQNAEGYFPRLEFGMTTGSFPIVAWQVR